MSKLQRRRAHEVISYISFVIWGALCYNFEIDLLARLLDIERGRETVRWSSLALNIHNTYDDITVLVAK